MPDVQFNCPHCGRLLTIDVEFVGKPVECPICREHSMVPTGLPLEGAGVVYAGFWRRAVAAMVDALVLVVPGVVAGGIFGFIIGRTLAAYGADIATIEVVCALAGNLLGVAINWLYYTIMESGARQATLGKMLLRIRVTDLDGQRVSFLRANGRYWGKIVSALLLMIGFYMAAFTRRKQTLHDMMAGCVVVRS